MLAKRSLALSSSAVLTQTILRRDDLADMQLATEVLGNAREQASQLLADAREQAQQEKDQALAQFWDSANIFLQRLERQRLALEREAISAVEDLFNSAMAQLLDETTLPERTRALVRNLAASQASEAVATLSYHPEMHGSLLQWLSDSRFAERWQLKADQSLAPLTLRLSDANGAFDIDWPSLRRGLLGAISAE
ncbi:type III secretion system stator protein SctL [Pseudomonas sp. FP1740]|jgi:type III secretion protein L|uniref:type III secretion system stator protein SctL n=1 Tax=Pseudomonas sp. FP1740 TaxID=2954078 RepID=UPI0027373A73|nr:type III secretion system stator protein SctL [Pseudomonas sp. FP1740]WLG46819.1 type III secretion system stator protein SctL [Pseudomonas sp. FP1740]